MLQQGAAQGRQYDPDRPQMTVDFSAMRRYAVAVVAAWTLVIAGSLVWNIYGERQRVYALAKHEALITYNKDQAFRQWATKHGGLYVPATKETPPNPYLTHVPERDVVLPSGKKLTLMNPAYALRQLMTDFREEYGVWGHITSLKPLNPINTPDVWERKALESFERGVTETTELTGADGSRVLRVMRPMVTKEGCLKCHAAQGYRVGDIRGGVSVTLPMEPYLSGLHAAYRNMLLTHGVIWLTGFGGIGFVYARSKRNLVQLAQAGENIALLDFALNNVREEAYLIGEDAGFHYVNDESCRALGYGRRELLGLHVADVDPDFPEGRWPEHWRDLKAKGSLTFEGRHRAKDGRIFPVEISANYFEFAGRGYNLALARDITERKQAEEELRRTNELLEQVFTAGHIMIAYLDREFNFIRVNDAYAAADGHAPDYYLGKNHFALFPNAENEEIFRTVVRTGVPYHAYEKPFEYAGGPERGVTYWDWTLQPVAGGDGIVEGLVLILQNVTERKLAAKEREKLEHQLRQAQKMEAVGALAGGVAHDFNNILTAIIGYTNLVKMKMQPDDPQRANVDAVLSAAERASHLTHSLLSFSRKQVVNPKPVDVNVAVKSVDALLRRLIGEDVDVVLRLGGEGMVVMADAGQIEQVLMNLATNARDAMPKGGTLSITSEEVVLGDGFMKTHAFGKPGRYALLTVSDTGAGMDAATKEKIFEPFFTTKEHGKGTGLGLSIVYGIVKQHGGSISVYSERGRGTTFKIYLPLISGAQEQGGGVEETAPRGGSETILIAEDDKAVRDLLRTMLGDFGYRVLEAVDGQEAIDLFRERAAEIDLVLLDVIMPKKNGRDVAETVRSQQPAAKLIFMSGYTADIILKNDIAEKGMVFLPKPVNPNDLLRKVREVLDAKT